ncbi:MAG TPA: histidine phosphatase family protein [Streptosporangiaceae bacterium]|jgi:phosphohistidine phosphatase
MTTADPSRRLVLLRHAKSAWPDLPDLDRPLAGRGRRDAPAAGRWLRDTGNVPDLVWCSPAVRARQTWELAAAQLGAQPPVEYEDRLYQASGRLLAGLIAAAPATARSLLLVGHNPGVQQAALSLAADPGGGPAHGYQRAAAKFPTAAIAVLELPAGWAALAPGTARLAAFVVPRDLHG